MTLQEVKRLKNNAKKTMIVTNFDCGPCAHCKIKNKEDCDDGYNCQKKK